MKRTAVGTRRIITETDLRVYRELTPMKKDQLDLVNAVVWIPDSKTPNGADLAVDAFRDQLQIAGDAPYLFTSDLGPSGLRRARVRRFRIHDLRSTYTTRLSAGGVADEWFRHSCDAVFASEAKEHGLGHRLEEQ